MPPQQLATEVVLQRLDLLNHGGRRHVQLFGRGTKGLVPSDDLEGTE
jgi:hypothetical protein